MHMDTMTDYCSLPREGKQGLIQDFYRGEGGGPGGVGTGVGGRGGGNRGKRKVERCL